MDKNVRAVVLHDEPEALLRAEPLNCPLCHLVRLPFELPPTELVDASLFGVRSYRTGEQRKRGATNIRCGVN
jgi:hypothetical protein